MILELLLQKWTREAESKYEQETHLKCYFTRDEYVEAYIGANCMLWEAGKENHDVYKLR